MDSDLKRLFELNELARQEAARHVRKRPLCETLLRPKGRAFTGIVGPRGVGKTVILRQLAAATADSFYLSLDTLGETDFFALARTLRERYRVKLLLLDEVHFLKGCQAALKTLHDFLDLRVVFTSSVSLSLYESSHDLSRRVRLRRLDPFSFGEYLLFRNSAAPPGLTLADIADGRWTPEHERQGYLFDDYLKGGLYPFALDEPDILPALENVVEKVITRDIPAVARLSTDEPGLIRKLVRFVAKSAPDGINYSSISSNLGVTKYKAEQYVGLLEKAFVLNPVLPAGTNVLREPKVLMTVPLRLLHQGFDSALGGLREDFAVEMLKMRCATVQYLKSPRGGKTPDFLVAENGREIVVEVGGRGKGMTQFKGYRASKRLLLSHDGQGRGPRRPLFLLGFIPDAA